MIYHLVLILLLNKTLGIMTAFALIPSQVPGVSHKPRRKGSKAAVLHAAQQAETSDGESDADAGDQVVYSPPPEDLSDAASNASTASSSSKRKKKKRISLSRTGNLPDVHWRAISMSHLRSHPNFQPLPPPSMINRLPTKEHVRYFRQDSWQWDWLHTGRCTTSQCSAALGFLEPNAAEFLGIPKSLQRGGGSAWDRLRQAPAVDQSLESMEQILCEGRAASHDNEVDVGSWRPGAKESDRLWVPASRLRLSSIRTKPFPFTAKYIPPLTHDELYQRKLYMQEHHLSPSPMQTRMQWGNAQEATSILTALNYFCAIDNRTVVAEIGMCGAKFDDEVDDPLQGVKIGASPDALICHGDGTVEVLEVKNHCPFVWNRISPQYKNSTRSSRHSTNRKKNKGRKQKGKGDDKRRDGPAALSPKHYLIRDFQLERRIPPVYIPQLMMEMVCVGDSVHLDDESESKSTSPACKSAVMVRQTATKGAILLRLNRDEEWIDEMKYFIGRFQVEYVKTGMIPEDNFFWNDDPNPNSRYRKFLQRTLELSQSVEQVAFIEHAGIQRMVMERGVGSEVPLFLDRVDQEA